MGKINGWVRIHVPRPLRRNPLGTAFMFMWGVLGTALFLDTDLYEPWPDLLWPGTAESLATPSAYTGYYWTAVSMMAASVIYLISMLFIEKKTAAFARWVSLWIALVTTVSMALGIVGIAGRETTAETWPISLIVWLTLAFFFVLALRMANCQYRNHQGVTEVCITPREAPGWKHKH